MSREIIAMNGGSRRHNRRSCFRTPFSSGTTCIGRACPFPTRTMDAEARTVIADAMATTAWDPSYGLNFCLLHVSTAGAFLIAGVWRGHQELWERIYAKDLATDSPFGRVEVGEDGPVGCVWEM